MRSNPTWSKKFFFSRHSVPFALVTCAFTRENGDESSTSGRLSLPTVSGFFQPPSSHVFSFFFPLSAFPRFIFPPLSSFPSSVSRLIVFLKCFSILLNFLLIICFCSLSVFPALKSKKMRGGGKKRKPVVRFPSFVFSSGTVVSCASLPDRLLWFLSFSLSFCLLFLFY